MCMNACGKTKYTFTVCSEINTFTFVTQYVCVPLFYTFFDSSWIPSILKALWDNESLLELNKKVDVTVDSRKDKSKRVCSTNQPANVVRYLCCHHLLPPPDLQMQSLWDLWWQNHFCHHFTHQKSLVTNSVVSKKDLVCWVLYKQYSLCLCCRMGFYVKYIFVVSNC